MRLSAVLYAVVKTSIIFQYQNCANIMGVCNKLCIACFYLVFNISFALTEENAQMGGL